MTNVDLIPRLQAALAALGDGRDARSDRERADYRATHTALLRCVSELRDDDYIKKPLRLLAEFEERRAATLAKQAEIELAIANAPDWQAIRDRREREREYDRQHVLGVQLRRLAEGTLLAAPGVMFWPLAALDARREELQRVIKERQARRTALLRAAERLLDAEHLMSVSAVVSVSS